MQLSVNLRRFSRKRTGHRRLPFPASPNLRIAQLAAVSSFDRVGAFPPERWQELEAYRPHALVGPAANLQRLAERVQLGTVELTTVDRAVFALTECGDMPLSDVARVILWQTFGVPVYELFIGADSNLLASECEAHEGWHAEPHVNFYVKQNELFVEVRGRTTVRTGLSASVETSTCACGRRGVRVVNVEASVARELSQELAATA